VVISKALQLNAPNMGPQEKLAGRRMLIWLQNSNFAAWACAACNWGVSAPGVQAADGPPPSVLEAFNQHDCAKSPRQNWIR